MAAPSTAARSSLGLNLVLLAGIGLIGYGLMFWYRSYHGFIELGLTPALIGGTEQQIMAFSMNLHHYIMHLQVAVAAFIIAIGVAVLLLGHYGIRAGQRWAVWTAFVVPVIGVGIALPPHYMYGFATMGHLGAIYGDAVILLAGTILCLRDLKA